VFKALALLAKQFGSMQRDQGNYSSRAGLDLSASLMDIARASLDERKPRN
jgi:hypothetical protein